ncbi:MAG: Ig-like domain-containing protein, partial [Cellvibrionaceae bacterium]|nr:Ig-like domain-containing protein [Cellvibrionaceae bacterium]
NIGDSDSQAVTIDTSGPGGSSYRITISDTADGTINSSEAESVTLTGQIGANDSVSSIVITDSANNSHTVAAGDITVNAQGAISVSGQDLRSLADGSLTVKLTVTDTAGNSAEFSDTASLDQSVTDVTIKIVTLNDDNSRAGNFHTNDSTPKLTGTLSKALAAGELVQVSTDGENWANAYSVQTGWSYQDGVSRNDGDVTYQVRVVDAVGNVGGTTSQVVTIDTVNPGASAGSSHFIRIEDGGDGKLNSSETESIELTGKIAPGETIGGLLLSDGSNSIVVFPSNITVDSSGNVSVKNLDVSSLDDGTITATLNVSDKAGNSATFTDTAAKESSFSGAISIDSISDDTGTGGDFITRDTQLRINGSLNNDLPAGNKLQISTDGNTWTDVSVNNKSWSYNDPTTRADGEINYQLRVIDNDGNNVSNTSQKVVVDTAAPGSVSSEDYSIEFDLNGAADFRANKTSAVTFSGKVKSTDTVDSVTIEGGDHTVNVKASDISVDAQGNVSISAQDLYHFNSKEISVSMQVTDGAGNTGTIEEEITVLAPTSVTISGEVHQLPAADEHFEIWIGDKLVGTPVMDGLKFTMEISETTLGIGTHQLELWVNGGPNWAAKGDESQWTMWADSISQTTSTLTIDYDKYTFDYKYEPRSNTSNHRSKETVTTEFPETENDTPLILDLDGDGVETTSLASGVDFDLNADGIIDRSAWAAADDAFLVRDINRDGQINDGSELFGEHTILADGSKAKDGFEALAELDSNRDGVFDKTDVAYSEIQVWQDINQDGVAQQGELRSLSQAGVSEIQLEAQSLYEVQYGNITALRSSWTDSEGNSHDIDDVWLENIKGQTEQASETPSDYQGFSAMAGAGLIGGGMLTAHELQDLYQGVGYELAPDFGAWGGGFLQSFQSVGVVQTAYPDGPQFLDKAELAERHYDAGSDWQETDKGEMAARYETEAEDLKGDSAMRFETEVEEFGEGFLSEAVGLFDLHYGNSIGGSFYGPDQGEPSVPWEGAQFETAEALDMLTELADDTLEALLGSLG